MERPQGSGETCLVEHPLGGKVEEEWDKELWRGDQEKGNDWNVNKLIVTTTAGPEG